MPIYTYKCPFCGYIIDIIHGMLDQNIYKCRRPDYECSGVLERVYNNETAPQLHASAIPSRVNREYKEEN